MDNPAAVVDKHRAVKLTGIRNGVKEYAALGRQDLAKTYDRFGDWLKKLSYNKYIKIIMLHECMSDALVNTIGRAIIGQYDEELLRIRFLIDEDFIRGPDLSLFWHELLRSNFYHASRENPVPILDRWEKKGHPFLDKYQKNGHLNLNELFWKYCTFVPSHRYFEIRIADAVNTIIFRYHNRGQCTEAYNLIRQCFLKER
jgi:hypothetical protein